MQLFFKATNFFLENRLVFDIPSDANISQIWHINTDTIKVYTEIISLEDFKKLNLRQRLIKAIIAGENALPIIKELTKEEKIKQIIAKELTSIRLKLIDNKINIYIREEKDPSFIILMPLSKNEEFLILNLNQNFMREKFPEIEFVHSIEELHRILDEIDIITIIHSNPTVPKELKKKKNVK